MIAQLEEAEIEERDVKNENCPSMNPSIEEPLDFELRVLPKHLEYAFLGGNLTLPVIISSKLSRQQKQELLRTLEKHKNAIA